MRRAYQWNSDLQDEGEKDWCCVRLQNISLWKTWSKGCRTEAHGRGNSISTYVFTGLQDSDTKVFVLGMTMYDCHICIPIFKHSQSSNTPLSRHLWPMANGSSCCQPRQRPPWPKPVASRVSNVRVGTGEMRSSIGGGEKIYDSLGLDRFGWCMQVVILL